MTTINKDVGEFKGLKKYFWPIHNYELKKFLPMAAMIALIIFVYSILRSTKDAIVVSDLGAEVISTIKLWGVLPSAVLFMFFYAKLCNLFTRPTVFYLIIGSFISFFTIFVLFLHPNSNSIAIDFSETIREYPRLKYPLMAIGHWSYTLFYIMSELWGSVMLSLSFWQFANQITTIPEAKRFYALFGVIGQIGMMLSGSVITFGRNFANEDFSIILNLIVVAMVVAGILIAILYWFMQTYVLIDPKFYKVDEKGKSSFKKKIRLSVMESFKYIFSSPYLGLIALLVICYGISINLAEGVWKSQINIKYPTKSEYLGFMGHFQTYSGLINITLMLLSSSFLTRFSWKTCALITPAMIFVTGVLFFIFIIFRTDLEPHFIGLGISTLMLTVLFGSLQNILSKGAKYSLFDSTKEMAYIPLDDELKTKGKAAVDVTGGRFGKSGGAIIQWALLTIFPAASLIELTPQIFVIFVIIMVVWFVTVSSLSIKFKKLTDEKEIIS